MKMQAIFEVDDTGHTVPRWPIKETGTAIEPDGTKILSVSQAAELSGEPEASLRERFHSAFGALLDGNLLASETMRVGAPKPQPGAVRISDELFRDLFYPHFDDAQFSYLESEGERLGLNPRSRHLYAELRYNEDTKRMEVIIIVGIHGLRAIAAETGEYAGSDAAILTFDVDNIRPTSAVTTVWRMTQGVRCPFTKKVHGDEYYPLMRGDRSGEMPKDYLDRCSEAGALRKAFPKLAGLYDPYEMRRSRQGNEQKARIAADRGDVHPARRPAIVAAGGHDDDRARDDDAYERDEEMTPRAFKLALMDMGFKTDGDRDAVTRKLAARFKHPHTSESEFYRRGLRDLRERPAVYGVEMATEVATA
jgi:hypothetical protein